MTSLQLLGAGLLFAVFAGMFIASALAIGLKHALVVWVGAILLVTVIVIGLALIDTNSFLHTGEWRR